MKIFLDDIRNAPEGWVTVRDNEEAILVIVNALYDEVPVELMSLDHDLGEGKKNGYDLLCFLERMAAKGAWGYIPNEMQIHSANPVGRKNMQATIDSIKRMREAGIK